MGDAYIVRKGANGGVLYVDNAITPFSSMYVKSNYWADQPRIKKYDNNTSSDDTWRMITLLIHNHILYAFNPYNYPANDIHNINNSYYKYDLKTGEFEILTAPRSSDQTYAGSVDYNGYAYIFYNSSQKLYKLDYETGVFTYVGALPGTNNVQPCVYNGYIYDFNDSYIKRFDGTTWTTTNKYINYTDCKQIIAYENKLYIGGYASATYIYDPTTDTLTSSSSGVNFDGSIYQFLFIYDGKLRTKCLGDYNARNYVGSYWNTASSTWATDNIIFPIGLNTGIIVTDPDTNEIHVMNGSYQNSTTYEGVNKYHFKYGNILISIT